MKSAHPQSQSASPLMRQNRQGQWLAMLVLVVGVLVIFAAHSWRGQQQQRLTQAKQTARLANQQLNNLQTWQQRLPAIGLYERQSLASPLTAQAVTVALAKLRQDPNVQQLRPQLGDLMVGAARYPLEDQLDGTTDQGLKLNAFKLQLAVKTADDLQGRMVVMGLAAQLPGFVIPLQLTQKPLPASDKSPALVESQWQLLLIGLADPLPAWPALIADGQAASASETPSQAGDGDRDGDGSTRPFGLQAGLQGGLMAGQRPLLSPEAAGLVDPLARAIPPSSLAAGDVGTGGTNPMAVSAILYLNPDRWSFWLNGQKYDSSSPSIQLGDWQLLTVSPQSTLWQHSVDGRLMTLATASGTASMRAPHSDVAISKAPALDSAPAGLRPAGYHPTDEEEDAPAAAPVPQDAAILPPPPLANPPSANTPVKSLANPLANSLANTQSNPPAKPKGNKTPAAAAAATPKTSDPSSTPKETVAP
ncbi:MAG: hypothetical protein INF41_02395 [Rhodospirillaceae bacterium]|nr:hypothetical protein [Rhodospirillaceae bacterium]